MESSYEDIGPTREECSALLWNTHQLTQGPRNRVGLVLRYKRESLVRNTRQSRSSVRKESMQACVAHTRSTPAIKWRCLSLSNTEPPHEASA